VPATVAGTWPEEAAVKWKNVKRKPLRTKLVQKITSISISISVSIYVYIYIFQYEYIKYITFYNLIKIDNRTSGTHIKHGNIMLA